MSSSSTTSRSRSRSRLRSRSRSRSPVSRSRQAAAAKTTSRPRSRSKSPFAVASDDFDFVLVKKGEKTLLQMLSDLQKLDDVEKTVFVNILPKQFEAIYGESRLKRHKHIRDLYVFRSKWTGQNLILYTTTEQVRMPLNEYGIFDRTTFHVVGTKDDIELFEAMLKENKTIFSYDMIGGTSKLTFW